MTPHSLASTAPCCLLSLLTEAAACLAWTAAYCLFPDALKECSFWFLGTWPCSSLLDCPGTGCSPLLFTSHWRPYPQRLPGPYWSLASGSPQAGLSQPQPVSSYCLQSLYGHSLGQVFLLGPISQDGSYCVQTYPLCAC